jgi:hypothetical protein
MTWLYLILSLPFALCGAILLARSVPVRWLRYRLKWRANTAARKRLAPRLVPYMRARKGDRPGQGLRRAAKSALGEGKITARQAEYFGVFAPGRGLKK